MDCSALPTDISSNFNITYSKLIASTSMQPALGFIDFMYYFDNITFRFVYLSTVSFANNSFILNVFSRDSALSFKRLTVSYFAVSDLLLSEMFLSIELVVNSPWTLTPSAPLSSNYSFANTIPPLITINYLVSIAAMDLYSQSANL